MVDAKRILLLLDIGEGERVTFESDDADVVRHLVETVTAVDEDMDG